MKNFRPDHQEPEANSQAFFREIDASPPACF